MANKYNLSKITDNRIGIFDETGKIIRLPARFATGRAWLKTVSPSPTRAALGEDGRFFCFLPILVARIPSAIEEELLKHVGAAIISDEKPVVAKPVTTTEVKPSTIDKE